MNQLELNTNSCFIQTDTQKQKLELYSEHTRDKTCCNKVATFNAMTVRGVEIEFTDVSLDPHYEGTLFQMGATQEILSIPLTERDARLTATADAYLLSKGVEKLHKADLAIFSVGSIGLVAGCAGLAFGSIVLPPLASCYALYIPSTIEFAKIAYRSHKSVKDAKDTKELAKSLLIQNNINISQHLKKIDFNKMSLYKINNPKVISPMRHGKVFLACLPVNTHRTRKHLYNVFKEPFLFNKLKEIINNRENYSFCPNSNNTQKGKFSEEGWRNILALCITPPYSHQSHPNTVTALAPALNNTLNNTSVENATLAHQDIQLHSLQKHDLPPSYDSSNDSGCSTPHVPVMH